MARVSDAHLEARRRSILDAACTVFSSKGVEAATMAEIARIAGISPGAIYRYFPSKEDLARGCMSESAFAVKDQWTNNPNPEDRAMTQFANLARATFALLDEPADRIDTLMFLESVLRAVREGEDSILADIRSEHAMIAAGITARLEVAREQGDFPPNLDPGRIAFSLLAFYWGARIARLVSPDVQILGWLEEMVALLETAGGCSEEQRARR